MNDHLNSTFIPERVVDSINAHQSVLAPEMEEFFARWTSREDAIQAWNAEVELMRAFARLRPDIVRNQIEEQFGLGEPVNLTLTANPEMGYIRVNTLDITQGLPGLSDPSIWTGQYYTGIPLTITAVPNPGYAFAGWEGINENSQEIIFNLREDILISPIFFKTD